MEDVEQEVAADQNENNEIQANQPNQGEANQIAVAQDWNPVIEWDRGGEDITWERVCLIYLSFYLIIC